MTKQDIDFILERFDKTEPEMQRAIVAGLVERLAIAAADAAALREDKERLLEALKDITLLEPGSRGAYQKFIDAKRIAAAAIDEARKEQP